MKIKIKGELFKSGDFYYYSPGIYNRVQKYGSSMIRRAERIFKITKIKFNINKISSE